jgi:thymidine phosphorylase
MTAVGTAMGVEIHTLLHPMSEPTGHTVGNALEVIEAIQCLEGAGPPDLRTLTLDLAEPIAGIPRAELEKLLDSGAPREKFDDIVSTQGGTPADLPRLAKIHHAPLIREVPCPTTGTIEKMDAGRIGQAALQLGAGRSRADDPVDCAVGFDQLAKTGQTIHAGQSLGRIHARSQTDFDMAEALFFQAVRIRTHA